MAADGRDVHRHPRGERFVPPPSVYREEGGQDDEPRRCAPRHYHESLPARFAWSIYRSVYGDAIEESMARSVAAGEVLADVPCVSPCMMHVWTYPNPKGVYAHDPPPVENRGGSPAREPGFDTWADPGEHDPGWDVLPDELVREAEEGVSGGLGGWLDREFGR